jgi:hypothetical protein
MPEQADSPTDPTGARESTYQTIVQALKRNPAYLLMFSIGLLGGGMGVGSVAVGFYSENTTFMVLGFSSWALLVVATSLVILYVERPRQRRSSLLDLLDDKARESFHAGADATELSGEWDVKWYSGEGASLVPYSPDPEERIAVNAFRSGLCCTAVDESTKKRYWLLGRVSTRQCVPMLYWSQQGETEILTGVVLLRKEETGLGPLRFNGIWSGFTRDGAVTRGECEWTRRI